jgi:Capsule polysaccharide biosynthesis protein
MRRVYRYLRKWVLIVSKITPINKILVFSLRSLLGATHRIGFISNLFSRFPWYYLSFAQILRQLGDSCGALETIFKGLPFHRQNDQFYFRISQIYRENYEIGEAHRYLDFAERLNPGVNTIYKLCFESEYGLFEEGSKSIVKVLALPIDIIKSQLHNIDRVSIYYQEYQLHLDKLRHQIKEDLITQPYENTKDLSNAVAYLIGFRQMEAAIQLKADQHLDINPVVQARLDRIVNCFGSNIGFIDCAWDNELATDTYAFVDGAKVLIDDIDKDSLKIIEIFLPPAIFDYPNREKQTHETIRGTFLNIVSILFQTKGVILIPRIQLNWRECFPKISDSHVISYHTSAEFSRFHLHIQESPFTGYCSFDHSGFAGFSSISTNHEKIVQFVKNIDPEQLELNQVEMYNKYVNHNISKYEQPNRSKPITGRYVFVALQVATDVVAKLAWLSGVELLEIVAAHYRGTATKVVVKRHPFCRSMKVQKYLERLELSGDITRTSSSIHEVVKNAMIVFTVNSGVGLEALVQGKTVVTSGACDYSYATKSARNPDELHSILASDLEPNHQRIQELLYYYIHSFAIPSTDTERLAARLERWLAN